MHRTAIITGAAQGIGRSIAIRLSRDGGRLVLVDKDAEKLAVFSGELLRDGVEAAILAGDITNPATPRDAVELALARFGDLGILINNAGIAGSPPLTELSRELWDRQIAVNLTGSMEMTKAVLPEMVRRRWGRIITLSSVFGLVGVRSSSSYAVTKAALAALTRSTAADYGAYGITSNAIAPGPIKTELAMGILPKRPNWFRHVVLNGSPVRRWGRVEDIANAAAFFASEEASFVNGQVLAVDGGWSATRFWPDEVVDDLP